MVFKQGPYGQAGFGHAEMDSPREHTRGARGSPCTWARHPLPQQIPKEADSWGRTVGSTSRSWVINPSVLKGHLGVHLSIHDRHTSPPTGHHWELAVIGSQVGVHGLLWIKQYLAGIKERCYGSSHSVKKKKKEKDLFTLNSVSHLSTSKPWEQEKDSPGCLIYGFIIDNQDWLELTTDSVI